jgi:hypothetical protein
MGVAGLDSASATGAIIPTSCAIAMADADSCTAGMISCAADRTLCAAPEGNLTSGTAAGIPCGMAGASPASCEAGDIAVKTSAAAEVGTIL